MKNSVPNLKFGYQVAMFITSALYLVAFRCTIFYHLLGLSPPITVIQRQDSTYDGRLYAFTAGSDN